MRGESRRLVLLLAMSRSLGSLVESPALPSLRYSAWTAATLPSPFRRRSVERVGSTRRDCPYRCRLSHKPRYATGSAPNPKRALTTVETAPSHGPDLEHPLSDVCPCSQADARGAKLKQPSRAEQPPRV